jgi:NADH-quinone oxidoreductase subunit J
LEDTIKALSFYFFAIITILSACVVVFAKNLVRATFSLLFSFLGIAGLYIFLGADFLATTQVLVYVGGILILLLFAVMLTHKKDWFELSVGTFRALPGALFALIIMAILFGVIFITGWSKSAEPQIKETTATIGVMLMKDYLLPFEIVSVLLLVVLIGAVFIARREVAE